MAPAIPEALSLAPGASLTPSNGSDALESMSPDITTYRSVGTRAGKIAITLTTSVGSGILRSPLITLDCVKTRRQSPHSREMVSKDALIHRRAAPMPLVSDSVSDKVWRVPNPANLRMSFSIRVADTCSARPCNSLGVTR